LLNELTSEQISEWQAYNTIEPIGDWTNDLRLARLSALIVNIVNSVLGSKESNKMVSPKEFMPNWGGEKKQKKQQSVDEMKETLTNLASQFGKGKNKSG